MTTPNGSEPSASHAHHHDHSFADPERIARLRDEAELLAPITEIAIDRLRAVLGNVTPANIVDLGSGPGVGTCQLADAFPTAHVTAVDSAAATLDEVRERAERLGLGDRVGTVQLELPDGITTLPVADVYWASMSLHHVGDEMGLLRLLRERIRPGGCLCVIEWDQPLHPVDVAELAATGASARLITAWQAWFAQMRSGLPDWVPSRPYTEMMTDAGFSVVVAETVTHTFLPRLSSTEQLFAGRWLAGTVERLEPFANASDLDAIAELIEPDGDSRDEPRAIDSVGFATTRLLTIARPGTSPGETRDDVAADR